MLSALKFVQGSVARKDFVQALQHFRIQNGTIKGFNGLIGLCTPIDLDLDITPKADIFAKAIETCQETIAMHITPTGKLSIKSGKFKALVECIPPESYPEILPEGDNISLNSPILESIKALAPFISDDAAKPWSRGILFKGQSAYATNNIILAEAWLGTDFPVTVNIPKTTISELIRIGEEPISLQVSPNRITFHFEGDRWLCSQTYSTEWPDVSRILDAGVACDPITIPEGMFEALEDLAPFTDAFDRVFIQSDGKLSTHIDDLEGATIEVPDLVDLKGCYGRKYLLSLSGVAEEIDFANYPNPCHFFGSKIRGVIIGMKT